MEERRAVVVGLGGLRGDCLRHQLDSGALYHAAPETTEAFLQGSVAWSLYSGGRLSDRSAQHNLCGPGWTSILTGAWANQHKEELTFNQSVPTLFNYVSNLYPNDTTAAVVSWPPLANIARLSFKVCVVGAGASVVETGKAVEDCAAWLEEDKTCIRIALALLSMDPPPRLLFLQLQALEAEGRARGFSARNPHYLAALRHHAALLDRLLRKIHQRRSAQGSSSPHSPQGETRLHSEGREHRENIWQNRLAWALVHDGSDGHFSPAVQGINAITPTVLHYLNRGWAEEDFPLVSASPIAHAPPRFLCLKFEPVEGDGYHPDGVRLADGYPLPLTTVFTTLCQIESDIHATFFTEGSLFMFLSNGTYIRCEGGECLRGSVHADFDIPRKAGVRVIGALPYPRDGCTVFLSNGTFLTFHSLPDARGSTTTPRGHYEFKSILGLKSLRNIILMLPRFESDAKATFILQDPDSGETTSVSVEVDDKEFGNPKQFLFSDIYRGLDALESQVCSASITREDAEYDAMIVFLNKIPYE